MLFSAPIFWGFFEFFYHKKVSQYYIINLRKSFSLSFLLSFLGIFLFFLFYSHNYENRATERDGEDWRIAEAVSFDPTLLHNANYTVTVGEDMFVSPNMSRMASQNARIPVN